MKTNTMKIAKALKQLKIISHHILLNYKVQIIYIMILVQIALLCLLFRFRLFMSPRWEESLVIFFMESREMLRTSIDETVIYLA